MRDQVSAEDFANERLALRIVMKQNGLSYAKLAELMPEEFHATRQKLFNWIGSNTPNAPRDPRVYAAIRKALGLPLSTWSVGVLTPATSPESSGLLGLRAGKMGKLKLVGSIGAGDADPWEIDEGTVFVPIQFAREDFGGFVAHRSAISLMPYIQPGDLVVVRLTKTPRIGKIGAVRGEGDMPVVKSVEWDGGQMVLRSTSEAFPDIKDGQIDYLGVLVGIASADGGLLIGPYDQGLGIDDLRKIFGGRL